VSDEDDPALTKAWRGVAAQTPAPLLDARILAAARAQTRRRMVAPLAALLAACLVLAFALLRQAPVPVPASAPRADSGAPYRLGMSLGRELYIPATTEDERQMLLRRQPGGALYAEIVQQ
jgi:hypothetical protein